MKIGRGKKTDPPVPTGRVIRSGNRTVVHFEADGKTRTVYVPAKPLVPKAAAHGQPSKASA